METKGLDNFRVEGGINWTKRQAGWPDYFLPRPLNRHVSGAEAAAGHRIFMPLKAVLGIQTATRESRGFQLSTECICGAIFSGFDIQPANRILRLSLCTIRNKKG